MPEQNVVDRARQDEQEGKSPSTQAGEFVREEIEHVRERKHGARSAKQAIAIGLSKARRAGVKLPPPQSGSPEVRRQAERDSEKGKHPEAPSRTRSRAVTNALKREGSQAASHEALSRQASESAGRRTPEQRESAARKAVRTKGPAGVKRAGEKAARTRAHG
jgi:hypothetical protein